MKAKVTYTVAKMGGIASYNMIAKKSCPWMTPACKIYCYADKGRFRYPSMQRFLLNNFEATKHDSFVSDILEQLNRAIKFFRWHPSGDIYNEAYYQSIIEIAVARPDIIFLAYTRNPNIDFNLAPSNLILYFTVDPTTTKWNKTASRIAHVTFLSHKSEFGHLQDLGEGFKVCTSNNCAECAYCWESGGNIIFPQKYKTLNQELIKLIVP